MHYAKTTAIAVATLAAGADASIVAPMADTYLQSDGTQAIDTGYYASGKTKVVIDFEPIKTNAVPIFGSYGNGLNYQFGLAITTTQNGENVFGTYMPGGKSTTGESGVVKLARYTAILDAVARTVTISNFVQCTTLAYGDNTTNTNQFPLAVFARCVAADTYRMGYCGKIYSMQIFDDGTLVRDFIPYGRGAVTGLYDRVNGRVHEKAIGNDFVLGHGDAYVRGSETAPAYVNTGVPPTPATKVEIDFAMMSATANSRVFGNLGGGNFSMDLHVDKDGSGNFFYSMQDGATGYSMNAPVDAERHMYTLSTNEVLLTSSGGTVTNQLITSLKGARTKTANGPMVVFGASNSGNPVSGSQFPCDVKVYRMKIWENGTLVRDFTPFMKNGAAGFLDNCDPDESSNFHGTINANPLGYGGAMESDANPIPAFATNPQSGEAPVNGTLTLTASAPGATHYQWFLDGEMIEGATGATLAVEWTKNTRLVRTYKCIAFFDVFGYAESSEAVVTNAPAATVIYLR